MRTRLRTTAFLAVLAALALLAACSPGAPANTAPEVTITSPAGAITITVGEPVTFAATATDVQDGDIGANIAWSSSLDGALTLSATGQVYLSQGTHVITARVTDAGGLEGSASVTVTVAASVASHVVADGRILRLIGVAGDEIVDLDSAEISGAVVTPFLTVFGVTSHPTQPWLYTASMHPDWGYAQIDRFVVAGDTITHDGTAFSYALSEDGISCVGVSFEGCAPIGMVFSSDGSRFYVDEDNADTAQVFSVDAAGDLTFIAEGAATYMHGLTIDPTDTYLYNGSNVIEVTDDLPTTVHAGDGGSSTRLIDVGGSPALISTRGTSEVAIYDLTDPVAPTVLADLVVGGNQVRELALTPGGDRIVTAGRNNVHTLAFDGAVITPESAYTVAEAYDVEYRSVALAADGERVLATWFSQSSLAPAPGGLELFAIASDGSLTLLDSEKYAGNSRVVFALH